MTLRSGRQCARENETASQNLDWSGGGRAEVMRCTCWSGEGVGGEGLMHQSDADVGGGGAYAGGCFAYNVGPPAGYVLGQGGMVMMM